MYNRSRQIFQAVLHRSLNAQTCSYSMFMVHRTSLPFLLSEGLCFNYWVLLAEKGHTEWNYKMAACTDVEGEDDSSATAELGETHESTECSRAATHGRKWASLELNSVFSEAELKTYFTLFHECNNTDWNLTSQMPKCTKKKKITQFSQLTRRNSTRLFIPGTI